MAGTSKENNKLKKKRKGRPDWVKGMPAPPGAGRPKGKTDSAFCARQRNKHDVLLWRQMEKAAKKDGFATLAHWLWEKAKSNPKLETMLIEHVLRMLGKETVGETVEKLALKGMLRDVLSAEAATGESGGQTINIMTGGGIMAPTEDMRDIEAIDVVPTTALPMSDDSSSEDDDDAVVTEEED